MILFSKMFSVFYTVKFVYICVFMAFYISRCLCDTIMGPVNVCCYVCNAKNIYVNNNNKFLIQSAVSAK